MSAPNVPSKSSITPEEDIFERELPSQALITAYRQQAAQKLQQALSQNSLPLNRRIQAGELTVPAELAIPVLNWNASDATQSTHYTQIVYEKVTADYYQNQPVRPKLVSAFCTLFPTHSSNPEDIKKTFLSPDFYIVWAAMTEQLFASIETRQNDDNIETKLANRGIIIEARKHQDWDFSRTHKEVYLRLNFVHQRNLCLQELIKDSDSGRGFLPELIKAYKQCHDPETLIAAAKIIQLRIHDLVDVVIFGEQLAEPFSWEGFIANLHALESPISEFLSLPEAKQASVKAFTQALSIAATHATQSDHWLNFYLTLDPIPNTLPEVKILQNALKNAPAFSQKLKEGVRGPNASATLSSTRYQTEYVEYTPPVVLPPVATIKANRELAAKRLAEALANHSFPEVTPQANGLTAPVLDWNTADAPQLQHYAQLVFARGLYWTESEGPYSTYEKEYCETIIKKDGTPFSRLKAPGCSPFFMEKCPQVLEKAFRALFPNFAADPEGIKNTFLSTAFDPIWMAMTERLLTSLGSLDFPKELRPPAHYQAWFSAPQGPIIKILQDCGISIDWDMEVPLTPPAFIEYWTRTNLTRLKKKQRQEQCLENYKQCFANTNLGISLPETVAWELLEAIDNMVYRSSHYTHRLISSDAAALEESFPPKADRWHNVLIEDGWTWFVRKVDALEKSIETFTDPQIFELQKFSKRLLGAIDKEPVLQFLLTVESVPETLAQIQDFQRAAKNAKVFMQKSNHTPNSTASSMPQLTSPDSMPGLVFTEKETAKIINQFTKGLENATLGWYHSGRFSTYAAALNNDSDDEVYLDATGMQTGWSILSNVMKFFDTFKPELSILINNPDFQPIKTPHEKWLGLFEKAKIQWLPRIEHAELMKACEPETLAEEWDIAVLTALRERAESSNIAAAIPAKENARYEPRQRIDIAALDARITEVKKDPNAPTKTLELAAKRAQIKAEIEAVQKLRNQYNALKTGYKTLCTYPAPFTKVSDYENRITDWEQHLSQLRALLNTHPLPSGNTDEASLLRADIEGLIVGIEGGTLKTLRENKAAKFPSILSSQSASLAAAPSQVFSNEGNSQPAPRSIDIPAAKPSAARLYGLILSLAGAAVMYFWGQYLLSSAAYYTGFTFFASLAAYSALTLAIGGFVVTAALGAMATSVFGDKTSASKTAFASTLNSASQPEVFVRSGRELMFGYRNTANKTVGNDLKTNSDEQYSHRQKTKISQLAHL